MNDLDRMDHRRARISALVRDEPHDRAARQALKEITDEEGRRMVREERVDRILQSQPKPAQAPDDEPRLPLFLFGIFTGFCFGAMIWASFAPM